METGQLLVSYWLDANVFIEAAKGPYGFSIVPGFWAFLEGLALRGTIGSSVLVYSELKEGGDHLAVWAGSQQHLNLFREPDADVQTRFGEIADHILRRYDEANASNFLASADPWLIAHASAEGGTLVTLEVRVPENSRKIKIPNVCDHLGVRTINTYQMLRELGANLTA